MLNAKNKDQHVIIELASKPFINNVNKQATVPKLHVISALLKIIPTARKINQPPTIPADSPPKATINLPTKPPIKINPNRHSSS